MIVKIVIFIVIITTISLLIGIITKKPSPTTASTPMTSRSLDWLKGLKPIGIIIAKTALVVAVIFLVWSGLRWFAYQSDWSVVQPPPRHGQSSLSPREKLEQAPLGTWIQFGPREWRTMAPPDPNWSKPLPDHEREVDFWAESKSGNHNTKLNSGEVIEVRNGKAPDFGRLNQVARWKFQSTTNRPEEIIFSLQ